MREGLLEIYRHHRWANLNLLEVCDGLPDEALDAGADGTYGTVRDTLVHLLASEERYLMRMTGRDEGADPLREGTFPGTDELKRRARSSGDELVGLVETVTANESVDVEFGGRRYAIPLSIFFAQAINHGTEHRAHVCTALTQHGIEPPVLDVWTYLRSGAAGR